MLFSYSIITKKKRRLHETGKFDRHDIFYNKDMTERNTNLITFYIIKTIMYIPSLTLRQTLETSQPGLKPTVFFHSPLSSSSPHLR